MNFTRVLVQNRRDAGALLMPESVDAPYRLRDAGSDIAAIEDIIHSAFFRIVASEYIYTADWDFDDPKDFSAMVMAEFSNMLEDIGDLYAGSVSSTSDDWARESADLEAHAVRFNLERWKASLNAVIDLLHHGNVYDVSNRVIVQPPEAKPEWAREFEELGCERPSVHTLAAIVRALTTALAQENFGELNQALRTIEISKISSECIIAIVRTTYHVRSKLTAWRAFLNSARTEVAKRGLDPKEVFFGLV